MINLWHAFTQIANINLWLFYSCIYKEKEKMYNCFAGIIIWQWLPHIGIRRTLEYFLLIIRSFQTETGYIFVQMKMLNMFTFVQSILPAAKLHCKWNYRCHPMPHFFREEVFSFSPSNFADELEIQKAWVKKKKIVSLCYYLL